MLLHIILSLFLCVLSHAHSEENHSVIFVYGTSCAGKSTLAKNLAKTLGDSWQYIDRDEVIEEHADMPAQEIELRADDYVLEKAVTLLQNGSSVVIDTQLHSHMLDKLPGFKTFSVLVYAPLSCLMKRDTLRQTIICRSEQRQFYARAYILTTFSQLFALSTDNEEYVDLVHAQDIPEDLLTFCTEEETYTLIHTICSHPTSLCLVSKEPYDVLVRSNIQSIEESVQRVIEVFEDIPTSRSSSDR